MSEYYYLTASLPSLRFGDQPPMSGAGFLDRCSPWLSDRDLSVVSGASIDEPFCGDCATGAAQRWKDFETNLRNELALARSRRLDGEARHYLRPVSDLFAALPGRVHEILNEASPLNAERRLIALRWEFLDSIEGEYAFDEGFLTVYHLKLQLLERLARFDREKGFAFFKSIYREI